MIRVRTTAEVRYGHFRDFLEISNELEELSKARGFKPSTRLVQSTGQANIVVIETDYPDLAAFEKESKAAQKDEEFSKLLRRGAEFLVQGSIRTELLRSIEDVV